jgi:hypothetical protein
MPPVSIASSTARSIFASSSATRARSALASTGRCFSPAIASSSNPQSITREPMRRSAAPAASSIRRSRQVHGLPDHARNARGAALSSSSAGTSAGSPSAASFSIRSSCQVRLFKRAAVSRIWVTFSMSGFSVARSTVILGSFGTSRSGVLRLALCALEPRSRRGRTFGHDSPPLGARRSKAARRAGAVPGLRERP